jgi:hypothetical protein
MCPVGKNGIIYFFSDTLRQCNGVNSAVGTYVNGSRSGTDNLFQELNVFPFRKSQSGKGSDPKSPYRKENIGFSQTNRIKKNPLDKW